MATNYKKLACDRIEHLREFLKFTVDHEVLVCSDGPKAVKFMDTYGAAALYVSGSTWKDLYNSLCAVEDAIEFIIVAGNAND